MFTAATRQHSWKTEKAVRSHKSQTPDLLWPDYQEESEDMGLFEVQDVPTRQAQREDSKKRLREAQESSSLEVFLAELNAKEARREASGQSASPKGERDRERSPDSGDSVDTKRRRDRKPHADNLEKPDPTTAAKTKACRERQRRERLNDSFNELTRTLDHEKPMKAEKTVIIAETIKVLVSLRAENGQFRQHNKLLEDRLKDAERERTELRMRVAMLQHQQSLGEDLPGSYMPRVNSLEALPRQQSSLPSADAQGVVVGVPVEAMQPVRQGGISQLLQRQNSFQHQGPMTQQQNAYQQRNSLRQQSALQLQAAHLRPQGPSHLLPPLAAPESLQHDSPIVSTAFVSSAAVMSTPEANRLAVQDPFVPAFVDDFSFPAELGSFGDLGLSDAGMGVSGPMSWLPGSSLDTSQDAVLRPPAA